ncbi:AAA family ATPase [Candidatus Haliotispira prima]|uniref:AAA family ATPase n=2 Tax=Candidatus Haliotispira prima TaxID=3034016 RepID=A0ABY8MK60_9SPIO|nr:AAA family ATPase [Candidatus Haliotispira prima]
MNIIGQEGLLRHLLLVLVGGGHILIEGVPGLAKTLAVRSMAESLQLNCKRIQFTPDLLPADLIGTMIFHQSKDEFVPRHGPIFTQILLADEINRAPAKVQSALLEAMGEQQVTIGDTSYKLPKPFFVMATQNPIEEEGTYPLPAAQLDRFDMKYVVRYPSPKDELELLMQYQHGQLGFQKTVCEAGETRGVEDEPPGKKRKDKPESQSKTQNKTQVEGHDEAHEDVHGYRLSPQDLFRMREIAGQIHLGEPLARYIINIVNATRETNSRLEFSRYLDLGASPRASLALCRYAALNALFSGRDHVLPHDIKVVCPAVLRHRLLLSYEAEAANQNADDVIQQILQTVVVP